MHKKSSSKSKRVINHRSFRSTNWIHPRLLICLLLLLIVLIGFIICSLIFLNAGLNNTSFTKNRNSIEKTNGLKQYVDERYSGVSFNYPSSWSIQDGNAGPVFTSTDKQIIFSIAGPYFDDNTPKRLAQTEASEGQVISKENIIIAGHQAIQQEMLTKDNYGKPLDEITTYIGNIKQTVHFGNGPTEQLYGTLVFYLSFSNQSVHGEAVNTLHQIFSSLILP